MADLLGSILGSMEKPPTMGEDELKKKKEMKKRMEKIKEQERQQINAFRTKMQQKMSEFIKDAKREKMKFDPMPKVYRAIIHEVAEVAGLTSFSFGEEDVDRYIMVWKKEFAPTDDELAAHRKGEDWDPEKAKQLARQKEAEQLRREESASKKTAQEVRPVTNYQDKYQNIMARQASEMEKMAGTGSRSYGIVSAENKMDKRTIEQVMADNKAKKRLKTEQAPEQSS